MLEQGTILPYPAVHLCLGFPLNPDSLEKYRKNFLKPNLTMSIAEIDKTLQSMLRFQRSSINITYNLPELLRNNVDEDLLRENLYKLYYKIDELLKDCYFKRRSVECIRIFKAVELPPGSCFVFNSIYTDENVHKTPNKITYKTFSEFDEDWTLRFKILYGKDTAILLYLKDPRSILSLIDYPNYVWRPRKRISEYGFTIQNMYTEANIREISLSRRKCLHYDEKFLDKELAQEFDTDFYNKDVCYNYCHIKKFIEYCNCMPSFGRKMFPKLSKNNKMCSIEDIECYESEYLKIRRNKCEGCYQNCNNTEYKSRPEIQIPKNIKEFVKKPVINSTLKMDYFEFSLDLEYWPIIRDRIIIIFSFTEFLVSLASTGNLFMGISYMALIEAFYNFFIRYPCSFFYNRNQILKDIKREEEIDSMKPIPCINMSLKPSLKIN
ncbi:pickpocket protein 28-like [Cochliomyia hominivorax]